jgi:hypothetical protein
VLHTGFTARQIFILHVSEVNEIHYIGVPGVPQPLLGFIRDLPHAAKAAGVGSKAFHSGQHK